MSAHIADYVLMQPRGSFTLPVWNTTEHLAVMTETEAVRSFRLPEGAVLAEPSIIAFVADPSSNTERIEYEIEINGHVIPMGNFGSGVTRGLWKIVGGNVLRAGDANTITFRVLEDEIPEHGGQPTVKFLDIVLWFQRAVAEAP
jgi:hypothetical protein